jgi:hypothetical protein
VSLFLSQTHQERKPKKVGQIEVKRSSQAKRSSKCRHACTKEEIKKTEEAITCKKRCANNFQLTTKTHIRIHTPVRKHMYTHTHLTNVLSIFKQCSTRHVGWNRWSKSCEERCNQEVGTGKSHCFIWNGIWRSIHFWSATVIGSPATLMCQMHKVDIFLVIQSGLIRCENSKYHCKNIVKEGCTCRFLCPEHMALHRARMTQKGTPHIYTSVIHNVLEAKTAKFTSIVMLFKFSCYINNLYLLFNWFGWTIFLLLLTQWCTKAKQACSEQGPSHVIMAKDRPPLLNFSSLIDIVEATNQVQSSVVTSLKQKFTAWEAAVNEWVR